MPSTSSIALSISLAITTVAIIGCVLSRHRRDSKRSQLRNEGIEVTARVTSRSFTKDAGFGDCDQLLVYSFETADNRLVSGHVRGPESSFGRLKESDPILVRYLKTNPQINLPVGMLEIVARV
jgi:hypothetical protein